MSATLADVLNTLGPHALTLIAGGERLDDPVTGTVVCGPGEALPPLRGAVLLLPGAETSAERTVGTVRAAGAEGYVAVVVKASGGLLDELARCAGQAPVALLRAPDELPWRHLDMLLTAGAHALGATGHPGLDAVVAGDVFALANAIASAVGGAVTIEDPDRRTVAYSNLPGQEIDEVRRSGIIGRRALAAQGTDDMYHAVLDAPGAVLVPSPGAGVAERLAVAVRAGSQVLGTVWVVADRPALPPGAGQVLEDAARTAALHLLRDRHRGDPEHEARAQALVSLLEGDGAVRWVRTRLGLQATSSSTVMAVRAVGAPDEARLAAARTADLVALYAGSWHQGAAVATEAGTVYALLPMQDAGAPRARLRTLAADLARAVHRSWGLEVAVGVGPTAAAPQHVPDSRRAADRVLEVLAERPAPATATDRPGAAPDGAVPGGQGGPGGRGGPRPGLVALAEDVRSELLLHTLADGPALEPASMLDTVQAVLRHDRAHGTEYARTLVAYYGHLGDVPRVAAGLVVHENTVRYRVRRAEELFGLGGMGPDDLLCLWLQLRLATRHRPGRRAG